MRSFILDVLSRRRQRQRLQLEIDRLAQVQDQKLETDANLRKFVNARLTALQADLENLTRRV